MKPSVARLPSRRSLTAELEFCKFSANEAMFYFVKIAKSDCQMVNVGYLKYTHSTFAHSFKCHMTWHQIVGCELLR